MADHYFIFYILHEYCFSGKNHNIVVGPLPRFNIYNTMTAELIKSWIVRDLGDGKNQPPHRILRGRLSRKTYLLFRFPIVLRYFLKSEKSKHGPSVEFLEIKGVDRPMQGLS